MTRAFRFWLILLALSLGALEPRLSLMSAAWAEDDDDDGGYDDDDDDGGPRYTPRPAPQFIPPPAPLAAPAPEYRPEILVMGLSEADFAALLARGFIPLEAMEAPAFGVTLRRLAPPPDMGLEAARAFARGLPSGLGADFNHFYRPNQGWACRGAQCPALAQVGWTPPPALAAAGGASCGAEIRIGMIDTGVNAAHEAFRGARLTLRSLGPPEGAPSEEMHGTSVAALLVGSPASSTPGVVPEAPLVAVNGFRRVGTDERMDAFILVQALGVLAEEGARVVNLSFAGPPNEVLSQALSRLIGERGVVVVASAGNGGPHAAPAWPAAHPEVIGVTAVDGAGMVWRRAGQGPHVDLAAPGVDVWTAASIRGGRAKSGTSFAAPFVTAAAARLLQAYPHLSPAEAAALLSAEAADLGAPGRDPVFGDGLVRFPPPPC